jgi:hypothetical protein
MNFIIEARGAAGCLRKFACIYGKEWEPVTLEPEDSFFENEDDAVFCVREMHTNDRLDGNPYHDYQVRRNGTNTGHFFLFAKP